MLFMVIERFRDNDMIPIYQRVRDGGRAIPAGLKYIDSWVEPNFSRCFQLSVDRLSAPTTTPSKPSDPRNSVQAAKFAA
jgi:hypothetical protein